MAVEVHSRNERHCATTGPVRHESLTPIHCHHIRPILINRGLRNEKKLMEIFNYGAIMAVGDFLFQSQQPLN